MKLQPFLLAALVASFATNAYFAYKLFGPERRIDAHSASIDQIEVIRTKGGLLQVSTIRAPETFTATKPHSVLGVDLGATTTQIRVPATFHYHIELAPEWKVTVRDKSFIVIAPAVKPTLPVAFDTTRLERLASGTWAFLTGTAELDALHKAISPILTQRAASPSYIGAQREAARQTVREFIAKWLFTQQRWQSAANYDIKAFFADEPIARLSAVPPAYAAVAQ